MKAKAFRITMLLTAALSIAAPTLLQAQEENDWGDAPEPAYKTLAASGGAYHAINTAVFLGAGVDAEPDGQPDANARGDDINILYPGIPYPPGDEDGVVFHSAFAQNQGVSLTVNASIAGKLDAWIDYNQDGTWGPAEQVFASKSLAAGANTLNFLVPAGAAVGQTYARFRFSTVGGLNPTGFAPDGEVEDYEIWIEPEQGDPNKMHWAQYPDPDGWDVMACFHEEMQMQKVLADDFRCTSNGPISHITFWGSWFNDEFDAQAPFQSITNIHLSIHSDIPDPDENGPEYSHPGNLLWAQDIDPNSPPPGWIISDPVEEDPSWQGWYDPNMDGVFTNNHQRYFRYDVQIPESEAFVQTEGTIYWLDISVGTTRGQWGWKTSRSTHFNDDAVWTDMPVNDPSQWNELHDPVYSNSLDLAFIIDGGAPPEEYDWGDLPDAFNTTSAANGACHTIVQGIYLGAGIDAEPDGQPSPGADGDDLAGPTPYPPGDEDGVVFLQPLVAGNIGGSALQVTASIGGTLEIWMDLDNSGSWTAGDNLYTGTIVAGPNMIPISIPSTTAAGPNVMRFRFNTLGAIGSPTGGPAVNGEVEDYKVYVEELDWGDALDNVVPTGYPTLSVNNGARHIITGLRLGSLIDPETDGQASNGADGDDLWDGSDDEDGVTFDTAPLIPGAWAQVTVTLNGFPGTTNYLQGWVDFYGNTNWTDTGEQIFTDVPLVSPGTYTLSFPVPTTASNGTAQARFRLSSHTGIPQTGLAYDGEVEDYAIEISKPVDLDWGDAYDSWQSPVYPTLYANNGACHVIDPSIFLGAGVDAEPDGQPNLPANGDDTNASYPGIPYPPGDEDGVTFTTPLQPGGYAGVDVVASKAGILDAWIDFNNDGDWADTGEQIFTHTVLSAGTNSLLFAVPLTAVQNNPAVARFRYSSAGVASYTGLASDGEVEDYLVDIESIEEQGTDFGDSPFVPETILPQGARHTIVAGVVLGAAIDAETDGQPDPQALGDDIANLPDEDGIAFTSKIVAGTNATVDVVAGVLGGKLDAWIDFDADGAWSPGEQIFISQSVSAGINHLSFLVPQPAALGTTFARFRISTAGGLAPIGGATDGEVEDYMVELFQPAPTNLVITNLTFLVSNTVAKIEWTSEANIIYQLQATTNLMVSNSFMDVETTVLGPVNWQTNSMSAETDKFYRVTAPWTP